MKVTITITDNPDGTASSHADFDPPVTDETCMTPAIALALRFIEVVGEMGGQTSTPALDDPS